MKKKRSFYGQSLWESKLLKVMKLTVLLILISLMGVFASETYSQTTRLTVNANKMSLEDFLVKIENQSEFRFFYTGKIDVEQEVSGEFRNKKIFDILDEIKDEAGFQYEVLGRQIILSPNDAEGAIKSIQQQYSVSGKVTDSSGQPIPGVTVVVKGTANGTVTNADGNYTLSNIPENEVLQFSFVGMKTQEIVVVGKTTVNVIMEEDAIGIEEVVAVGYGTQRKADITAAVSKVDLSTLKDISAVNASRLIQGQAAGVQVKQSSGLPGQELEIRVRGISSLGAGSEPLYVVDGFPVGNSLGQIISPKDIASITVLKDASATSIYGARGANGVVLIESKKAKEGDAKILFTSTFGVQNIPDSRKVDVLNAQEFAQFQNERISDNIRRNEGREPTITDIPEAWRYPEQIKTSTNWFDEITNQNAPMQEYGLTIINGANKTKSLLSIGYLKQDGSIINTDFQRLNARINLSNDFNKYVSVDWSLSGTYSTRNSPGTYEGNFTTSVINQVYLADPRDPVYNPDGTFKSYIGGKDGVFGYPNPVQRLYEEKNLSNNGILVSNGSIEIKPTKGLSLRSSLNVSLTNNNFRQFKPSSIADWNTPPPSQTYGYETYAKVINYAWDNILTYKPVLKNQSLDIMLGNTIQEENYEALAGDGRQFPDDLIPYISAAAQTTASVGLSDWSLAAFFARVNYSYLDKYLVSATMRREGSSRFGSNNKWGDFPSASVGWKISDEGFFPKTSFIDFLKLRGSWGITGNNNIGNYSHLARLSTSNYILNNKLAAGKVLSNFGNADLAWETSSQIDIGLDLAMFKGKLSVVTEYYNKITEDMLMPVEIPSVSGFTSALSNIGKVENKGYEFAAIYKDKIGQVSINSNFNIAFNKNKIIEINSQSDEIFSSTNFYGGNSIYRVGQPIGMLYGFAVEGIFETTEDLTKYPSHPGNTIGTYRYKDTNKDGKISYDTQDWDIIGNPHPKFTWGWNVNLTYQRFDLSFNFVGMQDYDLYRNVEHFTMNVDGVFNTSTVMIDRWRSPEHKGNGFAGTGNWQFTREANSKFVYDASHAWLRNINVGYNIPPIKNLLTMRVFFNVDNVALFTNYPGNNPQSNSGDPLNPQIVKLGVDNDVYPIPRIYSLGLNINL